MKKEGNYTVLIVLLIFAASILFSTSKFNTGFLAKSTTNWKTYGQTPTYAQVSPIESGSETQYASGGVGYCKCPLKKPDNYYKEYLAQDCDGRPDIDCGYCWVGAYINYRNEWSPLRGIEQRKCTVAQAVCGDYVVEGPEQCETAADCEVLFGPAPSQSEGYACENCQCISLTPGGL